MSEMVYAHTDSYLQFRIFLSQEDIRKLEKKRKLFCRVEKSYIEAIRRKKFPLWIYLCEEDIPRDDELGNWREDGRQKYELYISKRRLKLIKQKKCVDADSPRVWVRSVCISLEGVL